MTYDTGIGILGGQFLEQGEHRSLLGLSPGVIRTTFLIEPALVADAERATVVVTGMSATDILWENGDDGAVATDVIMVGGLAEAGHTCGDQGFDAERLIAARGTAVNDQQFDSRMLEFYFRHRNRLKDIVTY